ncbi:MAG: tetratricopeptide repeat protein, partial [bacterium]
PSEKLTPGNNVKHLNRQAAIHFKAGEYRKAIELWKKSLSKNPDQRHLYRSIGVAYYELGEPKQARKYLNNSARGIE